MRVSESISRDILRLFVWYPLRWLILMLPVSLGIGVMRMMGDLHHAFSRGKRRLLDENLSFLRETGHIDVRKDKDTIREYFRNHYIDRLLIFVFPRFGLLEVEKFVETEGLKYLDEAIKKGKGVILVHGHFGPVHLPLVALARLGYRMKQIGLPSDDGLSWIGRRVAFKLRMKYEAKMPAEVIKADSFLRPVFKWLKDNGVIMITGDGSGTDKRIGMHELFDFLGYPVMLPLGPAILANKTGALILPMFILPGEKKLYKIIIEAPLVSESDDGKNIMDVTGKFIRRFEAYILKCPGYMHFLDRCRHGYLFQHQRHVACFDETEKV